VPENAASIHPNGPPSFSQLVPGETFLRKRILANSANTTLETLKKGVHVRVPLVSFKVDLNCVADNAGPQNLAPLTQTTRYNAHTRGTDYDLTRQSPGEPHDVLSCKLLADSEVGFKTTKKTSSGQRLRFGGVALGAHKATSKINANAQSVRLSTRTSFTLVDAQFEENIRFVGIKGNIAMGRITSTQKDNGSETCIDALAVKAKVSAQLPIIGTNTAIDITITGKGRIGANDLNGFQVTGKAHALIGFGPRGKKKPKLKLD